MPHTDEWAELSDASNKAWDVQASLWDEIMGDEGNDFHRELIRPNVTELLDLKPGDHVLDLGCGNGVFARHLARLNVDVTAVDVSSVLIEKAEERSRDSEHSITYGLLDATSEDQLTALGEDRFDAVACNMTLMDLATIRPLAKQLPIMLKQNGRFVFSIMHPCFNNALGTNRMAEEIYDKDGMRHEYAIKVSAYITPVHGVSSGIGWRDIQHYFHRPLSALLTTFFEAGLSMDGIREPVFEPQEGGRILGQSQFMEIPWAFIARLRN